MTFSEVKAQKDKFIATFDNQFPDWFRGAGIGLPDTLTGECILKINIREDEDIYKLHKHILNKMPELKLYRVDFVGDIVAL